MSDLDSGQVDDHRPVTATPTPSPSQDPPFTVQLTPPSVERGTKATFIAKISSSNLQGGSLWISEIQCMIPVGHQAADLTRDSNAIECSTDNKWTANLPESLIGSSYFLKLEPVNSPYQLSRGSMCSFQFRLSVSQNANQPNIAIAVKGGVDKDESKHALYSYDWSILINDQDFKVSCFKCDPPQFLPGEPLTLSFKATGSDETDFDFWIEFSVGGSSASVQPKRVPGTNRFRADIDAAQSAQFSPSYPHITFKLLHQTSSLGQQKLDPIAEFAGEVSMPTISDFHICDLAGQRVTSVPMGNPVQLRWTLALPLSTTLKPSFSLFIGSSQPKIIEATADPNANGTTSADLTKSSYIYNLFDRGSLDWTSSPPQIFLNLMLVAKLSSAKVQDTICSAPASLNTRSPLLAFPGLETATINRNADSTWDTTKKTINPAPIGFLEHLNDSGLTLPMIWIPAGSFMMGSPPPLETWRVVNDGPQHQVQLQGFFLGQTPITQAQWLEVAQWQPPEGKSWGSLTPNPSHFKDPDLPVERVSWDDAMEFCNRLSQRTGRHYTLPSEAQWEYACRAGSTTPFAFGAKLTSELANYNTSITYADGPDGAFRRQTTKVGMFPANAWGLHDMHGNVWEWCLDHWHDSYDGAPSDGSAWLTPGASYRLLRGGSWCDEPHDCRSASRDSGRPAYVFSNFGVRPCCLLPPGPLLGS